MVTQVTAHQVGSYFVQQYYHMFQQQRDYVHQFYNDSSSMTRVNREINHSVTDLVNIHQLLLSLNFTAIEIKTINSLESWSGGVVVVVSGSVQSRDFNGRRRLVQTFFLDPQEKGYFVLNDMFHFTDEEVDHQSPPPATGEEPAVDYKPTISADLSNPTVVSNYALEEDVKSMVIQLIWKGIIQFKRTATKIIIKMMLSESQNQSSRPSPTEETRKFLLKTQAPSIKMWPQIRTNLSTQ